MARFLITTLCMTSLSLFFNAPLYGAPKTMPDFQLHQAIGELEISLDVLQEKLQILYGKIEELEHKMSQQELQFTSLENQMAVIFQEFAPSEPVPVSKEITSENLITENDNLNNNEAKIVKNLSETPNLEIMISPSPEESNNKKKEKLIIDSELIFNEAMAFFENKQYEQAENCLKKWVNQFPQDPKLADSLYWLGELAYMKNNFQEASINFLKCYKASPKGPKASHALLKLSIALHKFKKDEACCTTLTKLKDEFTKLDLTFKSQIESLSKEAGCNKN